MCCKVYILLVLGVDSATLRKIVGLVQPTESNASFSNAVYTDRHLRTPFNFEIHFIPSKLPNQYTLYFLYASSVVVKC